MLANSRGTETSLAHQLTGSERKGSRGNRSLNLQAVQEAGICGFDIRGSETRVE